MGDADLVRTLGMAGIRSACVTRPGWPADRSRFTAERVEWADNWGAPDRLLANLVEFARSKPEPPPLFFQHDGDLMLVSRNREALRPHLRFTIAAAEVIETCVDKTVFAVAGERLGLPVPRSVVLWPGVQPELPELDLEPPLVLKPLTRRDEWWRPLGGSAKAVQAGTRADLERLWPSLAAADVDLVVQEMVPGGEDRIESYHGYVDASGEVAAEFTGRKIRTYPQRFGETTACEITDAADVRELGRECMRRLRLTGVAKLDFKRDPGGRLHLLEANPRFNLWHLPGAVAGVNIPAVVYADLLDRPRPRIGPVRAGVRYSVVWKDFKAARAAGTPMRGWARWQARCDTRHNLALDDPMPFVGGMVLKRLRRVASPAGEAAR